jgi:hypothetical protein
MKRYLQIVTSVPRDGESDTRYTKYINKDCIVEIRFYVGSKYGDYIIEIFYNNGNSLAVESYIDQVSAYNRMEEIRQFLDE